MLDDRARRLVAPVVRAVGSPLTRRRVDPDLVTAVGLAVGLAAVAAIAAGQLLVGAGLFALNRLVDGVDGLVARSAGGTTTWGGALDLTADALVYVGVPLALAVDDPDRWPAAAVLCAAIAVNLVTVLTLAQAAADRAVPLAPGLVEGTETIVVYVVLLVVPGAAGPGLWIMAGATGLTAATRLARARPRRDGPGRRPPP